MRVSDNTNFGAVRESVRRSKERLEGLQRQYATLKKVNTPSDDPIGAAKILEARTEKVNNEQFQNNAKLAEAFLNNTDHALNELGEIVLRAKEIALGQASGASSSEESRLGVSEEITQLYNQAVAVANRRIGDRYLFGGFKTNKPPISQDGNYLGDRGQMMIEISKDVFVSMNVPGVDAFNTNPELNESQKNNYDGKGRVLASSPPLGEVQENSGEETSGVKQNVNLFGELQRLRVSLLTGDLDGIRSTLERFDDMHGQLTATRSKVGSRVQGLQSAIQAMERHNLTNAALTSNFEDADMAQVVSDMAREESVFRSSLASSQKLIQPKLMDFLK